MVNAFHFHYSLRHLKASLFIQRPNINIQVVIEKKTPAITRAHLLSPHLLILSVCTDRDH